MGFVVLCRDTAPSMGWGGLYGGLRRHGYIKGSLIERNKQDYYITANTFIVLPSSRPRVFTGEFSDPDLDDVVSTGSDIPVLNSPVPLH